MCGINGIVDTRSTADVAESVASMNYAMVHRGPDEGGVAKLDFGAVGMQRLSIIDIATGAQPMWTPDRRYCIVYNGELYNYTRYRERLQKNGYDFKTGSDTEVILNHFINSGLDGLSELNGMFAFAVVDTQTHSVTLVRDRVGIKPLYYFVSPDKGLTFSSEIGSLLANRSIPRKMDLASLSMFLVDRFVSDPFTLIEGVRQLPAGCWLKWQNGKVTQGAYVPDRRSPEMLDEATAQQEFGDLLEESISSQLVADVPVGVFLSGGIDSSAVASIAAEVSSSKIKTFSVGFDEEEFDESRVAREVSKHIESDHTEIRVRNDGFRFDVMERVIRHVGHPVADTSCIPMLMLCDETAQFVKVALSGDGGDECFGGYNHLNWYLQIRKLSSTIPLVIRKSVLQVLSNDSRLLRSALGEDRLRQARKAFHVSIQPRSEQLRYLMSLWTPEECPPIARASLESRANSYEEAHQMHSQLGPEEYAMRCLADTFMRGAILPKVDRMSMAASLEVRVPLLDNRVLDFAHRLPADLKIKNGTGKYLLRQAVANKLPASVFKHKKQGFSIPLSKWLNAEFHEYLAESSRPGSMLHSVFSDSVDHALQDLIQSDRSKTTAQSAAVRAWVFASIACWAAEFGVTV